MRADMHIHTTASDGTWDPDQVVEAVIQTGIEFFAISDHDSVANVKETGELAEKAGLKFIFSVMELIFRINSCWSCAGIISGCWKKRMTTVSVT